ncbi:nuclear transport factor 2 family protein [Edaphobacter albus]|uniref:nuclear transport factor 2 family protein n=1 Tax=Edaphobacter sp. 4G125 TaxID=2763071 RepID=UPI0016468B1F|nr:nuclear transport factor 2 family protein [Edaphobacter sp. 4G125]QNI36618.1 nuclear transport factor 2 family protein [Edaphobacter sp. 4G125]
MMAVVILACFIACARAQQQGQKHENKHDKHHESRKQIEAMEEQWRVAQLAGDAATMGRLLSDDFIGISMSGQVHTKAQQLERIQTRKVVLTKMDLSDMKVKVLDSVAIVTGQVDVEGTSEGTSVKGVYRYTRVYQQLPSGQWKITSYESTKIRPAKSSQGEVKEPDSNEQNAVFEAAGRITSEGFHRTKALLSQGLGFMH